MQVMHMEEMDEPGSENNHLKWRGKELLLKMSLKDASSSVKTNEVYNIVNSDVILYSKRAVNIIPWCTY